MLDNHRFPSLTCPRITVQCPTMQEAASLLIVVPHLYVLRLATHKKQPPTLCTLSSCATRMFLVLLSVLAPTTGMHSITNSHMFAWPPAYFPGRASLVYA